LQACAGLCKQLTAAQHKTIKLTAARDKLEIILHDLETASAEEQQQLEHQLAAANKSLRSTSQQLIAAQQQLVQAQQELAASQQKLQSSAEHLAGMQQQLADTTAELQQLRNAVPNCTAAAPVAGTSAQVGLRHWLQAQS
jgi:chromosome segregation ATPase